MTEDGCPCPNHPVFYPVRSSLAPRLTLAVTSKRVNLVFKT